MCINIAREAMGESQSSYGATSYKDVAWFIGLYVYNYYLYVSDIAPTPLL